MYQMHLISQKCLTWDKKNEDIMKIKHNSDGGLLSHLCVVFVVVFTILQPHSQ